MTARTKIDSSARMRPGCLLLVELYGQPGWVAALTSLSVDGMIVAAPTTLLADPRSNGRGGFLPSALL